MTLKEEIDLIVEANKTEERRTAMDKMKTKRILKIIKRDLDYYMREYELSQKEAYEILYEQYYLCMRLTQSFVEIDTRERIHKILKREEADDEAKNQTNDLSNK